MAEHSREAIQSAKHKVAIALLVGLILPVLTVSLMYSGFQFGRSIGKPFDMFLALAGAFVGFGLGSVIAWKTIRHL